MYEREHQVKDLLRDAREEVERQGVNLGTVAGVLGGSAGTTLAGFVRRMSR